MKCWAVQKLLALYVGESDLPIGSKSIQRHLENCSACNQIYQEYLIPKKALSDLKKPDLPIDFFASSWEKIYSEISQPPEKIKVKTKLPALEWQWLKQPALALVLICLSVFVFYENFSPKAAFPQISPVANTSPSMSKEKIAMPFPNLWEKKTESMPVVLQSFVEYHLEQVKPLETQDASF